MPQQPGEPIQIDHLSASRESKQLKEFKAVSPVGKQMVVQVFSRATAHNAKRFLETVRAQLPFPHVFNGVDGGSEFRADFERFCEELNIPLFVLPPKTPQLNGRVEHAKDTTGIKFWNRYDGDLTVVAANRTLADYQRFYH
ncbi:MAG: transposase family protein [Gammaproteobacteria bacterium]|nr:transposase family protein [Gammaproteobacteria bacterium]MYH45682.1 transposase family protein [Gammaproteobacteria bacterium]MYL12632.1 transposase family protein [Gammaproteobacteria bacterium]